MNQFEWSLIIMFVLFLIAVTVILILRFTTSKNLAANSQMSFADLFRKMPNTDNIELSVPFRITASSLKNAMYVPHMGATKVIKANHDQLIGIVFRVVKPTPVVACMLFGYPRLPHTVALYKCSDHSELANITVNRNNNYTRKFKQPLMLEPSETYVLVTQRFAGETYMTDIQIHQLNPAFEIVRGMVTDNTSVMSFPERVIPTPEYYCGMLIDDSVGNTIFEIHENGLATLPPRYISGFTCSVDPGKPYVLVQPGIATSANSSSPILLRTSILVKNQYGLNGVDVWPFVSDTWYNIYAIGAADDVHYPTGCILSLNSDAPTVLPDGYTNYRRIGTVRTTNTSSTEIFYAMQQQSPGGLRLTYLTGDITRRTFVNSGVTTPDFVTVDVPYLPPTATNTFISVRGSMEQQDRNDPTTPMNAMVYFRNVGELFDDQSKKLGILNSKETFGEINVKLKPSVGTKSIQYRLFPMPNTGGSIPNSLTPLLRFVVNCSIEAYTEILD